MKRRVWISLLVAGTAVVPASAQELQSINLDAGLWENTIALEVVPHGVIKRESQRFCLDETEANMTASEIIRRMSQDQCSSSNEVLLVGSGSANLTCTYPEDNARGEGRFEATYTTTTVDVDARMTFVGPGGTTRAIFAGRIRRVGDC